VAFAQGTPRPDGPPPRIDVAKVLGIDAARTKKVEAILDASHEKRHALREQRDAAKDDASREAVRAKMEAIREDTRKQLAAVLTPEEMKKLHDALPKPPRPDGKNGKGPAAS
jgi:hypothetical protein